MSKNSRKRSSVNVDLGEATPTEVKAYDQVRYKLVGESFYVNLGPRPHETTYQIRKHPMFIR